MEVGGRPCSVHTSDVPAAHDAVAISDLQRGQAKVLIQGTCGFTKHEYNTSVCA